MSSQARIDGPLQRSQHVLVHDARKGSVHLAAHVSRKSYSACHAESLSEAPVAERNLTSSSVWE